MGWKIVLSVRHLKVLNNSILKSDNPCEPTPLQHPMPSLEHRYLSGTPNMWKRFAKYLRATRSPQAIPTLSSRFGSIELHISAI